MRVVEIKLLHRSIVPRCVAFCESKSVQEFLKGGACSVLGIRDPTEFAEGVCIALKIFSKTEFRKHLMSLSMIVIWPMLFAIPNPFYE